MNARVSSNYPVRPEGWSAKRWAKFMRGLTDVQRLFSVTVKFSASPEPHRYVRLGDIPEPYQSEFYRFSADHPHPLHPNEGDCAYIWDYRDWLRTFEAPAATPYVRGNIDVSTIN